MQIIFLPYILHIYGMHLINFIARLAWKDVTNCWLNSKFSLPFFQLRAQGFFGFKLFESQQLYSIENHFWAE